MTPQVLFTPSDLGKALVIARQFGTPMQLPARLLGLGADETRVPSWAWVVLAFGAGAIVASVYGPKFRDFLEDHGIGR